MAGALANGSSGSSGTRLETLKGWTLPNDGFSDDQFVSGELVIVLGVCDRAFESFPDQVCRLTGSICQSIEGFRDSESLNFTSDVAHLFRRNPSVFGSRANLHQFCGSVVENKFGGVAWAHLIVLICQ